MKNQNGKETDRPFAPNKRDPGDKYKVRIVPTKPTTEVGKDGQRPIVTKKEKK